MLSQAQLAALVEIERQLTLVQEQATLIQEQAVLVHGQAALTQGHAALVQEQVALIRALEGPPTYFPLPTDDLNALLLSAAPRAIVDLGGQEFLTGAVTVPQEVTLRNGTIRANVDNLNDLVTVRGDNVTFDNVVLFGNGTTKRGIALYGRNFTLTNSQVRNIRRPNQETNCLAMWDSPGPLTVTNTVLEGGSQCFLAGGSAPTVPNTIATDLLFDNVTFTYPLEWRGQPGMSRKTAFELKCARNVTVRNSTIENVFVEGQTGIAITLTPSQYGNSPNTVVENVLFENNVIRNCSGGVTMLGFSQHQADPTRTTLRSNNLRFVGNQFTLSKALYGGQGALMTIGWGPNNVVWEGNTVVADGDAFIRVTDSRVIDNFRFVAANLVDRAGTYGIFSPLGSRGAGFATLFPAGVIEANTFITAHSTFRANFANNTYA